MLAAGEGSAPNPGRAAAYHRVAAEAGDGPSQNEWGVLLLEGDAATSGVEQAGSSSPFIHSFAF